MKVQNCEKCRFFERRVWTQYYKPLGYHTVGMNHAYGYCGLRSERCAKVKKCRHAAKSR